MKTLLFFVVGVVLTGIGFFVMPQMFPSHEIISSLLFEIPGVICGFVGLVRLSQKNKSKAK